MTRSIQLVVVAGSVLLLVLVAAISAECDITSDITTPREFNADECSGFVYFTSLVSISSHVVFHPGLTLYFEAGAGLVIENGGSARFNGNPFSVNSAWLGVTLIDVPEPVIQDGIYVSGTHFHSISLAVHANSFTLINSSLAVNASNFVTGTNGPPIVKYTGSTPSTISLVGCKIPLSASLLSIESHGDMKIEVRDAVNAPPSGIGRRSEIKVAGNLELSYLNNQLREEMEVYSMRGNITLVNSLLRTIDISGGSAQSIRSNTINGNATITTAANSEIKGNTFNQNTILNLPESSSVNVESNTFNGVHNENVLYVESSDNSELILKSNTVVNVIASQLLSLKTEPTSVISVEYNTFSNATASVCFNLASAYEISFQYNMIALATCTTLVQTGGLVQVQPMKNNYWGVSDGAIIRSHMTDMTKQMTIAFVDFSPYLTSNSLEADTSTENSTSTVYGNEVIEAGESVVLSNNLVITEGSTLTVYENAILNLDEDRSIIVFGTLKLLGSDNEPISLTGLAGVSWKGIYFHASGQHAIQHVHFINHINGIHYLVASDEVLRVEHSQIDAPVSDNAASLTGNFELVNVDLSSARDSACIDSGAIVTIEHSEINCDFVLSRSFTTVKINDSTITTQQLFTLNQAQSISITNSELYLLGGDGMKLASIAGTVLIDDNYISGSELVFSDISNSVNIIVSNNRFEQAKLSMPFDINCGTTSYHVSIIDNTFNSTDNSTSCISIAVSGTVDPMQCAYTIEGNTFNSFVSIDGLVPVTIDANNFLSDQFLDFNNATTGNLGSETREISCSNNYWNGRLDQLEVLSGIEYNSPVACHISSLRTSITLDSKSTIISWETTWKKNIPVYLPHGVQVYTPLSIEPGALIYLGDDANVTIRSSLNAIGTAEEKIQFLPLFSNKFGSLAIMASSHPAILEYVKVIGANLPISIRNRNVAMRHIEINESDETLIRSDSCFELSDSNLSNGAILIDYVQPGNGGYCAFNRNAFSNTPFILVTGSQIADQILFENNTITNSEFNYNSENSELVINDNNWQCANPATQVEIVSKAPVRFTDNTISECTLKTDISNSTGSFTHNTIAKVSLTFNPSSCSEQLLFSNNSISTDKNGAAVSFSGSTHLECVSLQYEFNTVDIVGMPLSSVVFDAPASSIPVMRMRRNLIRISPAVQLFNNPTNFTQVDLTENYWSSSDLSVLMDRLGSLNFVPYLLSNDFNSELGYLPQDSSQIQSSIEVSQTFADRTSTDQTSASPLFSSLFTSSSSQDEEASSSSLFPEISQASSETQGQSTFLQSSEIVQESSDVVEPSPSLIDPTTFSVKIDVTTSGCKKVSLRVQTQVSGIEYIWTIRNAGTGGVTDSFVDKSEIDIDLGSYFSGNYLAIVEASGLIQNVYVYANDTYSIEKPENRFGASCTGEVSFDSSFQTRTVVDRKNKVWIKTKVSPGTVVNYLWTATIRTIARSVKDASQYIITSPSASAVALGSETGLPADSEITLNLRLSDSSGTLLTKNIVFKTSPSKPIQPGQFAISTTETFGSFAGYALKTVFDLRASGWTAREGEELTYSFQYQDSRTRNYVTLTSTTDGFASLVLPPGPRTARYRHEMQLLVRNNWGDTASVRQPLIVIPGRLDRTTLSFLAQSAIMSNSTEFLSKATSIIGYINQHATGQSRQDVDAYQEVISDLLDHVSQMITEEEVINEQFLQQQIGFVSLLTKSENLISSDVKSKSLDLMQYVIDSYQQNKTTSGSYDVSMDTVTQIANVISNVVEAGFSNVTISEETLALTSRLAQVLLNQTIETEPAVTVISESFQLSIKIDYSEALGNYLIETENRQLGIVNSVQLPRNFSGDVVKGVSDIVSYIMLSYNKSPYAHEAVDQEQGIATPVVDLKFRYENGSIIPVNNLTNPLVLKISKPNRCDLVGDYSEFSCRYWDETDLIWKSDGCEWIKDQTSNSIVTCHCNHTTSFSAFILQKGKCPKIAPGMSATGIAFNSLYMVVCLPILILLFYLRDRQPVRSRFIAPFIGILAVMVDATLQGWINNSLALASKWEVKDGFSYVIMLVANPLSVAALFVFLWQQIRFVLLQNIYYLMRRKDGNNAGFIYVCRLLTSKIAFAVSALSVGAFVFAYFLALVVVAATRTNEIQTDTLIATLSTSYAAFVIVLSFAICSVLIVDIVLSFKRSAVSERGSDESNEIERVKQKKGVGVLIAHVRNDPLYFRAEAALIVGALLVLLVLYPLGIATVFKDSAAKSPDSIARYLIEIIYMLLQILAFGGFVCIVALKDRITKSSPIDKYVQSNVGGEGYNAQFMAFLRDPEGSKLMAEFCALEFSLENFLLFQELEDIRANNLILSEQERRAVLENLDELYIRNNSERQLNCDSIVRKTFYQVLQQESLSFPETEALYSKLHATCLMNLGDTYSRLVSTRSYAKYMKTREIQIELDSKL